jgi:hypothetical protein
MHTPVLVFEQSCPDGGTVAAWTLLLTRGMGGAFAGKAVYFAPGEPVRCPRSINASPCCISQRLAHQRVAGLARRLVVEHSFSAAVWPVDAQPELNLDPLPQPAQRQIRPAAAEARHIPTCGLFQLPPGRLRRPVFAGFAGARRIPAGNTAVDAVWC